MSPTHQPEPTEPTLSEQTLVSEPESLEQDAPATAATEAQAQADSDNSRLLARKSVSEFRTHLAKVSRSVDASVVRRRPTWTPAYHAATYGLNTFFHVMKDNVITGRSLMALGQLPKPVHVGIKKVLIPRRTDLLPFGMDVADAQGSITAEWIDSALSVDESKPSERVILYAHGGVYIGGSRKTHRQVTWRLAKYANARVLSIEYRLAPENKFPLAMHDMLSCYLYLIDPPAGSKAVKYRPDQIVFSGDSSGGNLCLVSSLFLRDNNPTIPQPAGLALLSPWLDVTHSSPSFVLNAQYDILPTKTEDKRHMSEDEGQYFVPSHMDLQDPMISPLFSKEDVNATNQLPPMLMQVGDAERLRDETIILFQEQYPNSKIRVEVYEDMVHTFHLFALAQPIAQFSLHNIAEFVKQVTSTANGEPFERRIVRVNNADKKQKEDRFEIVDFEPVDQFLHEERVKAAELLMKDLMK
ncbi:hypothetical protein HDU80_001320 [Chytriomyces hyalinus]|nr:hypothetical protein HDU80_001320 [Chytriomyces hyalinus]